MPLPPPVPDDFLLVEPEAADPALCNQLAEELKIPAAICRLLIRRGVDTAEKARWFFRPSLSHLADPFLLQDMEKACNRVIAAIQKQENIVLWGDYDVDGITATALVHNCLAPLGAKLKYHLPSRVEEGYGLSSEGIKAISGEGAQLLLVLDSGITARPEVELCNQLG